jgi:carbon-monoxide dehydrogenase medium subunit
MAILKDFNYHAPESLKEVLGLLRRSRKPMLLAGGTFVLNTLKKAATYPTDIIDLGRIKALHGIKDTGKEIAIGAMTPLSEIVSSTVISEFIPVLSRAAACVATTPLRHMGTIGGNVASRFFWVDLPAVLLALDAKIEWAAGPKIKILDIEEFLSLRGLAAKGILVRILIAKRALVAEYFRHTQTMEVDVPIAAMTFAAQKNGTVLKDVRMIVNTTLSPPVRAKLAESLLENVDVAQVKKNDVVAALKRDMEGGKLDDDRLHCLCVDVESLIQRLNRTA